MSYETMMYICIGVGVVFLTLSIILFFMFRIPSAISELSGRTARREIQEIMSRESTALPKGRKMKAGSRKTEKLKDRKIPVAKSGPGESLNERIVRETPVQNNYERNNDSGQNRSAMNNTPWTYDMALTPEHDRTEGQDAGSESAVRTPFNEPAPGDGRVAEDTALLKEDSGLPAKPHKEKAGDTMLLTEPPVPQAGDTMLLTEPPVQSAEQSIFELESQVMIVHSDEIID